MASIEELDKQITVFSVTYQKLLKERGELNPKIRDIRQKITDLVKNREIIELLTKKNVDTAGLEVIQGKLTMTAPIPKL